MIGAELALLLALVQQPVTVTLIVEGQEQTMTVKEAERLLQSSDLRLRVAATLALGTQLVTPEPLKLAPHDLFRERFQRQPAQAPIPGPFN